MPYSYPNDIPVTIQNIPAGAQKIWIEAFNAVLSETGNEDSARIAAWGRVKQEYKQESGKWVKKELKQIKENNMKKSVLIVNDTKDKGFFKALIPLNQKDGHIEILEKKAGDKTIKYLRGIATNTQVDKEDERMSKSFVDKIKQQILGLNVFVEHEHSIEKTVGYVDEVIDDGDNVIVDTALEDESENELVKKIVSKLKHGTKIGYSIGGRILKAKKVWDDFAKKTITEIEDGEIFELTLTALPAGVGTWTSPIKKSLKDLFDQPEIKKQLTEYESEEETTTENSDEGFVKKFTKALEEMVQANKLQDSMWDIFYSFRQAIYSILESDELNPTQKKEKIMALSNEFAVKVEQFASKIADLMSAIEEQIGVPVEN